MNISYSCISFSFIAMWMYFLNSSIHLQVKLYDYIYEPGYIHVNTHITNPAVPASLGVGLTILILAIMAGGVFLVRRKLSRRYQSKPHYIEEVAISKTGMVLKHSFYLLSNLLCCPNIQILLIDLS